MPSDLVVVLDTNVWISGVFQVLGEYQGVKVLSPREFAELLGIVAPLVSSDV